MNEYLEYVLAMAMADGLLDPVKQGHYLEQLRSWFVDVDLEAEYIRIQRNESRLPSAIRRRVEA